MPTRLIALLLTLAMLAGLLGILRNFQWSIHDIVTITLVAIGIMVGLSCVVRGSAFACRMAELLGHPVEGESRKPTRSELVILGLLAITVMLALACGR